MRIISKFKIVDTNILLSFPQIIQQESDLVIITDVLRELDGLKRDQNPEVAFQARRAAIVISRNIDSITFDNSQEQNKITVDDKLFEVTKSYAGTLITNDVYLKIKAKIAGLQTHGYGGSDDYTGVKTWIVELDEQGYSAELEEVLTQRRPPVQFTMKENEYLIIKDITGLILNILVQHNGELQEIEVREIRNKWIRKIYPRAGNPEQQCLFDALRNPDITIVYTGGTWGAGKSFILNNFALQELERGHINKIVYVPNNAHVANTMEVGTLPGELLPKISGQIGPLIDLIGIDEVQHMMDSRELEIVPMQDARGRSWDNSIIIVNEAQNLTDEHIKLLIARCGDGSRIFFDGDIKQIDSLAFKNKNGLKLLMKLADSEEYGKLFATIRLSRIERSKTAQAAGYLDELQGRL